MPNYTYTAVLFRELILEAKSKKKAEETLRKCINEIAPAGWKLLVDVRELEKHKPHITPMTAAELRDLQEETDH